MGFIEELRRQKEAERQAAERARQLAEERARQEQKLKLVAEGQRKVLEERRRQEIEKARQYFNKSDFPRLTHELASLAPGMKRIDGVVRDPRYTPRPERDIVGISLIWYGGKMGEHRKAGGYGRYREWQDIHKLIAIRCDHKGTITVVKSMGDIRLPLEKWSNNSAIQEKVLEKAYNNPRKFLLTVLMSPQRLPG